MLMCNRFLKSFKWNLLIYTVVYFYRTVEVNNTDAEGRLVLGDGVSAVLFFSLPRSKCCNLIWLVKCLNIVITTL